MGMHDHPDDSTSLTVIMITPNFESLFETMLYVSGAWNFLFDILYLIRLNRMTSSFAAFLINQCRLLLSQSIQDIYYR